MEEAKKRIIGLVIFWIGTSYLFVMSWAIMWWLIPKYRFFPLEHTGGTILAVGGPVFNPVFLSIPVGAPLMAIGLVLAEKNKSRIWPMIVVCAFLILIGMFPSKLAYYPTAFGIFGGLIVVLFIATLWFWAKRRRTLQGTAETGNTKHA
ncbi:MAG: hypothetical protein ACYTA5_26290 [Planctomycetota bacterium]|jgi:hypothetical protein